MLPLDWLINKHVVHESMALLLMRRNIDVEQETLRRKKNVLLWTEGWKLLAWPSCDVPELPVHHGCFETIQLLCRTEEKQKSSFYRQRSCSVLPSVNDSFCKSSPADRGGKNRALTHFTVREATKELTHSSLFVSPHFLLWNIRWNLRSCNLNRGFCQPVIWSHKTRNPQFSQKAQDDFFSLPTYFNITSYHH